MTTVIDLGTDGPRTHALLIGVGRYPCCGNRPAPDLGGPESGLALLFADLSSPPRSALDLATWLIDEQIGDEIAPLGTIELLVSHNVSPVITTPNGTVSVEEPTFDAVKDAFDRWYERCDADEDNVGIFFFSGHGCLHESEIVLLQDVGRSRLRFFENAIEIQKLRNGMGRCRARAVCFFIDACRTIPEDLLALRGIATNPLIQPHMHQRNGDRVAFFATTEGHSAFGTPGGRTYFADALLDALQGGAARRRDGGGDWEITTGGIVHAVNDALSSLGEHHQRCAIRGEDSDMPIRRLQTAPMVPFRVGCQPAEALPMAEFSLFDLDSGFRMGRGRDPEPWESSAAAMAYTLQARFEDCDFAGTKEQLPLMPPSVRRDLPVTHNGAGR